MIWKFLTAVAVIYLTWRLWHGRGPLPGTPRERAPDPPSGEPRDLAEARAVLGVRFDADEREIRAAHRTLIARVHPDRGGTADQAHAANAARDMLLRYRAERGDNS